MCVCACGGGGGGGGVAPWATEIYMPSPFLFKSVEVN